MSRIFLTENQVVQLLEKGTVKAGNALVVNTDKEVNDYERNLFACN